VAKGSNGEFLEAGAGNLTRVSGALPAETLVVQMNPEQVPQLGKSRIILETDTATPGTTLTSTENDRSPNGCLFKQIREFMFSNFVYCTISIFSRLCSNMVAHSLSLAAHGAL